MAAITETALQGEWFYLEEEQPLDRTTPSFYILRDGKAVRNDRPEDVGTYRIVEDGAIVTLPRSTRSALSIVLRSVGPVFDETMEYLQADATYVIEVGDEPLHFYGRSCGASRISRPPAMCRTGSADSRRTHHVDVFALFLSRH